MIVLSHDCHVIVVQDDRHVVVLCDSHVITLSHDSCIVIRSCVGNLHVIRHLCCMECALHCVHIGHLFSHPRCLPFTLKEPASLSALLRPVRFTRKPLMSFLTTKPGKSELAIELSSSTFFITAGRLHFFCFFCLLFVREMCLRYAQLEMKLGEIDRARAVYSHGSQFSDPRVRNYFLAGRG